MVDISIPTDAHIWYKNRLKTFEKWPFQSTSVSCNPESMASAGFVAIDGDKYPDLAQCVFCLKQLDGWESSDDPWEEHRRHDKINCPFVTLGKRDELEWTIEEGYNVAKKYFLNRMEIDKKNFIEECADAFRVKECDISLALRQTFSKKKRSSSSSHH